MREPIAEALHQCVTGNPDKSEEILRGMDEQDHPGIIFNLGWHTVRRGELNKGMKMMDAGRFLNAFGLPRIAGNIWRDEPLEGKTLLFRCEGGFGDQIINFRFAEDFKKLGARVVIACAKDLMPIFSRHGYVCVDNEYVSCVHYDYWVPAMSTAHMLGYEHETLCGKPYLHSDNVKQLYSEQGKLKVGIKWSGRPEFEHEQFRRFDPQPLIDLHEIPGVTLYSLQRDDNTIDGLPFADLRHQMTDWEATCSIIADLDLVITSCTSIAHLAAAMGKETWVIVPIMPYYTWSVPGEKSSWYGSVRLFRQETYGNWAAPLANVRQRLLEKIVCATL